ncbi:hypothetical protein [Thiolapillus sp.]|uniref:hypothetical protein n=1 Tax=Thiolapillus sp. TaxID=2017437 RepID=UPI0025FE4C55|nr:hypothetical protein [Thiolapillus sp.]
MPQTHLCYPQILLRSHIFKTQDVIAGSVTKHLKLTLFGELSKTTPTNPDAYTLYLQANHLHQKFTDEASKEAEDKVIQSIAIDPTYAPSWLLLSRIIFRATSYLYQKPFSDGLKSSALQHITPWIWGGWMRPLNCSRKQFVWIHI